MTTTHRRGLALSSALSPAAHVSIFPFKPLSLSPSLPLSPSRSLYPPRM